MGHDIWAFPAPPRKEIAYLRANWSEKLIYKVLNAEHANNKVSGDGSYWYFEEEDIEEALKKLGDRFLRSNKCVCREEEPRWMKY